MTIVDFSFCQVTSQATSKPFVVLELFTSQGCSSCPPADKLLGKIIDDAQKNNKPVYAMEFHVDYWNKYGWKDPYSSFKYTLRQQNYVNVLPITQAYTPQLIVNGETAFVGSDEKQANTLIEKSLKALATVDLTIQYKGSVNDSMLVDYAASKTDKNYSLKIALVEKKAANAVDKGENSGKTLSHHNVVCIFSSYDLKDLKGEIKLPLNKKIPDKNYMLIAFVQHRQSMKIVAATSVNLF
jgi:hypothetical protein